MPSTDAEVAVAAAVTGAEIVRRDYGQDGVRFAKSATDFATQTDRDAEAAIMDVLTRERPGDLRTGEETGDSGNAFGRRRWLVDPLCGTLNFAATTPLVAVNVALLDADTVRVAASVDPIACETFWTDGTQACIRRDDDQPLRPSPVSGIVEINCDGPLDRPFVGAQLAHDSSLRSAFGPRVISSTLGVAWVAAGRRAAYISDGTFRANLHFAAGIAIADAAGCVVTDFAGEPLHTGRGLIVAADRQTHEAMLALIAPHLAQVLAES